MKETILWTVIETNEIGDTRLMWTFDDEKQANNYVTQLENEEEKLQQIAPNAPVYYAVVKNKAYLNNFVHITDQQEAVRNVRKTLDKIILTGEDKLVSLKIINKGDRNG
tara:strand:+ start:425 stop:751 length:327 start_codon:yes stop_codon:yes gene_type:complete